VLEKNRTKEPLEQIETQGTYMKLGKAKRGEASHYASSWGNLNASRDIPRGGYAKVTNMENGKSTVVKINDYGPQSPSRIIDLSYVAFTQIASSGQGIAHNVKVEEILN
jgi:rare lipoprotein A